MTEAPGTVFLTKETRLRIAIFTTIILVLGLGTFGCRRDSAKPSKSAAVSGIKAFKKGDFKTAVSELEQAAKADPKNAKTRWMLGQSYEALGRLNKAAGAYRESLKRNPKQPDVLYKLGVVYKAQGRTGEAIEQLEKAVSVNPKAVGARLMLGDMYAAQGQKAKAAAEYQAVIDMRPFGVDLKAVKAKLDGVK